MHILAHLGAVPKAKQSEQLPLFELPTIGSARQNDDISETSESLASTLSLPQLESIRRLSLDHILAPASRESSKPTLEQVKRERDSQGTKFFTERVLARLEQLEAHESNTSLRSDYRQAFIAVSLASKGNPQAFLESSYAVHGIHPDKVWPRILNNRKERLGREYYQFFDSNDLPRPDVKWDATVIYDLPSSAGYPPSARLHALPDSGDATVREPDGPSSSLPADSSLAANRAASPSTAAKGGDEPVTGRDLSPLPPKNVPNRKERLA